MFVKSWKILGNVLVATGILAVRQGVLTIRIFTQSPKHNSAIPFLKLSAIPLVMVGMPELASHTCLNINTLLYFRTRDYVSSGL